jgi:hypothetical protein
MASLLDSIRDGLELVVDKTEEYSKIGKLKVDIFTTKRNIEKQFTELGGRVYDLINLEKTDSVEDDEEVKKIIEEIRVLEKQLVEKEANINIVKEEKEKERQERQEARKQKEDVSASEETDDTLADDIEDATVVDEKKND